MSIRPEIRYFIPCWKAPALSGNGPSVHEIVYAMRAKEGHSYPLWQQPMFVFVAITNLHGSCRFHLELRLEELEQETVIATTGEFEFESGNDPLHVFPLSIMMKAVTLPQPGVYQLYMVSQGEELAKATIHAR